MAEIGVDLERAAGLLREGQIVALPTETVYGLAGDALDPEAILRIYEAKRRPRFNPLIAHVHSLEAARPLIAALPEPAAHLAAAFWPGPLTLLLPRSARVPDLLTAGSARVAVRVPKHPLTLSLLERLGRPLAAPSANPSGYISPTTAQHVADQLGEVLPYILDGGPTEVGVESTIIGFDDGKPTIYRPGGLPIEAIEAVVGPLQVAAPEREGPASPGRLSSHYAPEARVILGDPRALMAAHPGRRLAALPWSRPLPELPAAQQIVLSPSGDPREGAQRLFAALRALDALDAELILAEPAPTEGLGVAINDRLARAAAERS
ncbi:MAG: threonylcarbamoyl-AMP synthase [Alphaproteobacteria bacterium]|nr:threonylcarbamoyl-AMP synthase [Alphaproteobacteria bacterium]